MPKLLKSIHCSVTHLVIFAFLTAQTAFAGHPNVGSSTLRDEPSGSDSNESLSKPNVILVITDDQGYGDLSCHGNPILKTPALDKLYSESIRLTDFHVTATCAPTRGALMSGHFTNRAGPWHTIMGRSMLFEGEKTLGEVFADNGYATGMFGKWHLGDNYPFRPEDRGFNEVVRHGGGGVGQTPDLWDNAYFDDMYFHNSEPTRYKGYCTDVFFAEARRFIEKSVAASKPFFVYISTNAPHGPFHCPDKYWKPYQEKVSDTEAIFFGMIANIDENVGALRKWLKEKGLAKNTVFIFMTDNGTASGDEVYDGGMRGKKGSEYEGGHRVPFFLHWPDGDLTEGTDIDRLTAHIDVLPTLIELCDLAPLQDYTFDGMSLMPLINNPKTKSWPDRTITTDSQRVRDPIKWRRASTMTERWRLINGEELYDIEADPKQKNNLAQQHSEVVQKLRANYEAWWDDISPAFKKDARIIVGNPAENPSHLTSHDWLADDGSKTPWNQRHIREATHGSGVWAIKVETSGKYRITLRRWPHEAPHAITAGIPGAGPVPGLKANRETPGKSIDAKTAGFEIGERTGEKPIPKNATSVSFDVKLEKGEAYLRSYFILNDGKKIGSFYTAVEKLK